jgi:hypothetical protein
VTTALSLVFALGVFGALSSAISRLAEKRTSEVVKKGRNMVFLSVDE